MLMNLMIKDAVLMGLAPLIGCGAPAFEGYYKIHQINGTRAIEFFKGKGPTLNSNEVTVLPYQPGKIASANVQAGEVISGEFTGCIMSVYLEDGTLKCAHVDTNLDNPQRKAYEAKKGNGTFSVRAEDDTTGKLPVLKNVTLNTRIICVADSRSVQHYFVERSEWRINFHKGQDSLTKYRCETNYRIVQVGG